MYYYITKSPRGKGGAAKFFVIFIIFFLCVLFFLILFLCNTRSVASVKEQAGYYFLVRDCEETTVAAVSSDVYRMGGAGYLMEVDGGLAVALSCYFSREDAESVQATLHEKGTQTRILSLASKDVVFYGNNAAKHAACVRAVLTTGRQCARILYDTANGLERATVSQAEGAIAMEGVTKVLRGLAGEDVSIHGRWNVALGELVRRGEELSLGVLFSKDVRYFQVELCSALAQIFKYYS